MSDGRSYFYVYFPDKLIECMRNREKEKGTKMNTRRSRRRPVPYRGNARRNGNKKGRLTTAVIVICLSIAAGYLTATYVLGPILGLDTAPLVFNENTDDTDDSDDEKDDSKTVIEDQTDVEPDETEGLAESGYVLQYGSFSSEEAAQNCINDLKKSGIEAEILEKDGAYKVVSPLFDTEEDARAKMEKQKGIVDVFVTQIP